VTSHHLYKKAELDKNSQGQYCAILYNQFLGIPYVQQDQELLTEELARIQFVFYGEDIPCTTQSFVKDADKRLLR